MMMMMMMMMIVIKQSLLTNLHDRTEAHHLTK